MERTPETPASPEGWTVDDLATDLAQASIAPGDLLVIHSSLSSIGHVKGGAATVVEAFVRAVGPTGTLLWPGLTFAGSMTMFLRDNPVVDLRRRPSHNGAIPRAAGERADAVRSIHPTHTAIGIGPKAGELFSGDQDGQGPLGTESPFFKAAQASGRIVLLGVTCRANTTLHCVEELAAPYIFGDETFDVRTIDLTGREHRIGVRGYTTCTPRCFESIEPRLVAEGIMTTGRMGAATVSILDGRRLLAEVTEWVRREPTLLGKPTG